MPCSTTAPTLTPFDTPLQALGQDLGFASERPVLCMISVTDAPVFEDLIPTLYRLHALAGITRAQVWAQCFDARRQGPVRPLDELVALVRRQDRGAGQRTGTFDARQRGPNVAMWPEGPLATVLEQRALHLTLTDTPAANEPVPVARSPRRL